MKRSLDMLDLTKLFASILILTMHCDALSDYGNASFYFQIAARWCVPFFFLSSSYFLFRKSGDGQLSKAALSGYVRRIALLYAVWFVYNLPEIWYQHFYQKDLSALGTWFDFLRNLLLSTTFGGSWYLTASVFSAALVWLLSKRLRTGTVLLVTLPLYLLCPLASVYRGAASSGLAAVLCFLRFPLNIFNGCFYFALGKLIAERRDEIMKWFTRSRAFLCFVVFYALYGLELYIARRSGIFGSTDAAFALAPLAFGLFLFVLQSERRVPRAPLLRKLSTVIYCCQGNLMLINGICKMRLGFPSPLAYLLCALLAGAICAAVLLLQTKTRWKWPQYMT